MGNILDEVLIIKGDENLVGPPPPPFAHPNYFSDKLLRAPHTGYPVTHFGYPGLQGKADVIQAPRIGAGRAPLRGPWLI